MSAPWHPTGTQELDAIDEVAALWVARRDRGLTPAQQDEFLQWLAADPRHGERLARHQRGWNQLARLALWCPEHAVNPNPDLLAPPPAMRRRRGSLLRWTIPLAVAAAAALIFGLFLSPPTTTPPEPTSSGFGYRQQVLDDGTLVELNHGARVAVKYSPTERRLQLEHGEALFTVARDPARPFVVVAGDVTVRAVGTAFHVRLGAAAVDVMVTEGRVQLDRPARPLVVPAELAAGQRLSLPYFGAPPAAVAITREEVDRALSWQPRLLEFASTPLAEVAAEFNRRNRMQLVVADEALRALPIGASFRSDNVDGFVRLLEASFGVQAERGAGTITLRRLP